MLFKEDHQNCSLIFFPESQKDKTGFLLGVNLTEFIVVVLDIVEVMSHEKSISELKSYVDLPAFKKVVKRFVNPNSYQSEIKVLGAIINPENPDSGTETVQKLSQFDVWLNLEYKPSEDKLTFRDLILCGYRYNTTCSIIYYDTEATGFLTTDGKLLEQSMAIPDSEHRIENDHFDINLYQVYKNLQSDEDHSVGGKQSQDVFESACKVINFRKLLLSIWGSVFNQADLLLVDPSRDDASRRSNSFDIENELIFGDGNVEKVQPRVRGGSSAIKATSKIFNFETEDMSSLDMLAGKRPKKFSEELLDDLEALVTPNIYRKQSVPNTIPRASEEKVTMTLKDIPAEEMKDLDPIKGRMMRKVPEWNFIFKFAAGLVQLMSILYLAAFKVANYIPYFDRILNTTYCHLLFRTKVALKLGCKLERLSVKQPVRNSVLLKEVSFLVNSLSLTVFDLLMGWVFFTTFCFYSEQVASSIRAAHLLIHPDVFKRQLAMILDNPAGIKLNQTYCGIISKLTQTIFILQDATLHFIIKHLWLILWLIVLSSLAGFTVALSIVCDLANCVIFHIKMTFGFINLIFSEHTSWFRIFWRISRGTRFNSQESRIQEQYYPPHVRYIAIFLGVVLFSLFPTITFYWLWSAMLLILVHLTIITLELVQTLICYFPLGSILTGKLLSKISPKLMHIKHISKIAEFRLQRKDIGNAWQFRKLAVEIRTMKGLKALTSALLSKPGSMIELIFPSKQDLRSIETDTVTECSMLDGFQKASQAIRHSAELYGIWSTFKLSLARELRRMVFLLSRNPEMLRSALFVMIRFLGLRVSQLARRFSDESPAKKKNFMKDFFKYVHPDILHTAPERVREENSRSMQTLNGYMDKVRKNEGSTSVEVRFYTPEKTTRKNKRYFFFKAKLDAFPGQLKDAELELVRLKASTVLIDNLNDVLEEHTGIKPKTAEKKDTQLPEGYTDLNEATFESHPGLFKRNSAKREAYSGEIAAINKAYSEYLSKSDNDKLLSDIMENITLVDPTNRHKKEYSMELMKNLEFMKNKDVLLSTLFDPKYIMLDNCLPDKIVLDFSRRIDKSPHKKASAEQLVQVFNKLRDNYPNLAIVLSDKYSIEVPGFMHVRWNDDLRKIVDFLVRNIDESLDKILSYQQEIKTLTDLKKDIEAEFNLAGLNLQFNSLNLQSETAFMVNLRSMLRKVVAEHPKIAANLRQIRFTLAEELSTSAFNYNLPWNFSVDEVKSRLTASFN